MSNTFSTIEEYIASFDAVSQGVLRQVKSVIDGVVPQDAVETISYGMPTYRYKGNMIHFALNKKHLGLYPGPAAIEAFAEQLASFRTSKGAIQLPLDQPLPERLIQDIVRFNVELLKEKGGSKAWDRYRTQWDACYELMGHVIAKTDLEKAFKWGTEVYTYRGKNVVSWGGFKHFFSVWFYNGVFLEDPEKVLVTASEGKTKGMRQWRFDHVHEMDEKKILAYIREAIQAIEDGKALAVERSVRTEPHGLLKEVLDRDPLFKAAFESLTAGKQKEYMAYIEDAKQEKTKRSRMEKIQPLVFAGLGLYDKYKK